MKENSTNGKLYSKGKAKFKFSRSGHLLVTGEINGKRGTFIVDSGAAISCVGNFYNEYFKLETSKSKYEIRALTDTAMKTHVSHNNELALGSWKGSKISFLTIDLSVVNETFAAIAQEHVQGIIGNDVLKKYKAVIDYENKSIHLIIKS